MPDSKPYRPNVGIALFNASGRVLIGRRFKDDGPEIILPGFEWQMPQGGIDADEDPRDAVMRELWEETGVTSADYLGETDWLTYEFPPFPGPSSHRLAKFRGQRQKWFALRFTGRDDEIARSRRRSSGAVQARCLSDGGAELFKIRGMTRAFSSEVDTGSRQENSVK
jgi:putative (di)nucleoside polyphosphate hydrolase